MAPPLPARQLAASLTPSNIAELRDLLTAFHDGLNVRVDPHARFEYMLDQMWDVFTSRNVEQGVNDDAPASVFALDDNLDTGNAAGMPFPPFLDALDAAVRQRERFRMYHGPWPLPELKQAVLSFLVEEGVIAAAEVERFDAGVGAGTVNLWDAICRLIVRRPGDAIAMPAIGYGFFVPQVCRAGGRILMLPVGEDGKPDAHAVGPAIDRFNAASLEQWRRTLRGRLAVRLDELRAVAGAGFRQPSAADVERVAVRAGAAQTPDELDAVLDAWLAATAFDGDAAAALAAAAACRPAAFGPPRVTGYLHINPNVMGASFTAPEVERLSAALAARNVLVVEDLAYHSIRRPLGALPSVLRHDVPAILLLGVSKPFCLADCRVGIVVGDAETTRKVLRAVETSIGWVPTYVQTALAALLESPGEQRDLYARQASEGSEGYAAKRELLIACLEGIGSERLADERRAWCEATIADAVGRLFAAKRAAGHTILDPTVPGLPAIAPAAYEREITRRFCAEGLGRWLELAHDPGAGFFAVVDVSRLLERAPLAGIPLSCSFDVFALLAFLAGVRTIPEETMGAWTSGSTRLRLTFSPPCETLAQALFTAYVVLERLERWDGASAAAAA